MTNVVMATDATGKQLVDLSATFGKKYRVTRECEGTTWYDWPALDRPWLYEICGKMGTVSPYGGDMLICSSDRPYAAKQLMALPFLLDKYGGSSKGEECVVRFHVKDVRAVLKIVRPRTKRQYTEDQLAVLRARGFKKGETSTQNSPERGLIPTNGSRDDGECQ